MNNLTNLPMSPIISGPLFGIRSSPLDGNDLLTNVGKYGKIILNSNQFSRTTHYFEKGI
jgi:hypothetical protein